MINKILKITNIFLKNSFSFSNIQSVKFNIKGIIKWIIIFVLIFIGLISYKILDLLSDIGQETAFLSVLFLILAFLVIFQTILICINLFYNSRDMEYILPMPIKPIELLISKFNVLLFTIYITEFVFTAVPLIIYGSTTQMPIIYYLHSLLVLVFFPIIPAILTCLLIMIFMILAKYFKNINRFHNFITITCTFLILIFSFIAINNTNMQSTVITDENVLKKIIEANFISENLAKYFPTIKHSIFALSSVNLGIGILNMLKLILITSIIYCFFILLGKSIYLKGILINLNKIKLSKKHKEYKIKDYKKKRMYSSYINKEWKNIYRSQIFFAQCILPAFYIPVMCIGMIFLIYKNIANVVGDIIDWDSFFSINVNLNLICIIIGLGQITNFMSIIAVTSFSRDGKNSTIVKYLPISYYRQFIYKSIPAIVLDMIPSLIITAASYFIFTNITIGIALVIILLSTLLNVIRVSLLQIVDLKKPKYNWDAEYILVRQNSNIIISIALLGIIILVLIYFARVLSKFSLTNSLITITSIFIILISIINTYVIKKKKELFKKII